MRCVWVGTEIDGAKNAEAGERGSSGGLYITAAGSWELGIGRFDCVVQQAGAVRYVVALVVGEVRQVR